MSATPLEPVAVVGSGLIGRAWAIAFARAGHKVRLFDQAAGAAAASVAYIESVLDDLAGNDLLRGATPAAVLARITIADRLADAVAGVIHVQENTPEVLATKQTVFAELDRVTPENAVIASSSSALVPSSFTGDLRGRARCLVIHPINPPYLIPAVEILPASWTSPDIVARAKAFMEAVGQAPIMMRKEIDGFVMNRMQAALMEEAMRLVEDGICSVDDVDVGIREGLALRWAFIGPFETIDLNAPGGARDYVTRYHDLFKKLYDSMQRRANWLGPVLDTVERERRAKLPADKLGERTRWRDRRLMALLRHKHAAAREIGD